MHFTLLIPYLFWPRETAAMAGEGLDLPALGALLARADAERFPAISTEAWLCQAFEVERQRDWPIAPLTLALDGGEPEGAYWLRADPVHVKVSREGLHLVDSTLFDVSADEAQSFTEALNAQFADSGVSFHAPHPKRWYARCASAPEIETHTLNEAAGQDVQQHLPRGEHALLWHRRFNEIQMLLHAHGANEAREERGEPAVNSVWFWGGGTTPSVPGRHFATVAGNDPTATALAVAADVAVRTLHPDGQTWLACASSTPSPLQHLTILDQLAAAVRYGDIAAWRARLAQLESDWFQPLLAAVRGGRLAQLDVVALGAENTCRFSITRGALLKLWRRAKPLASYS